MAQLLLMYMRIQFFYDESGNRGAKNKKQIQKFFKSEFNQVKKQEKRK